MKNAILNIKVDAKDKKRAQKLANDLGFSLSSVMSAYLKDFLRKERIDVSLQEKRKLSPWAEKELKESRQEVAAGYVSPIFDTIEEEFAWLEDEDAKYANGRLVQ
jgi:addiction module RelB/DinJ family antitoxin